LTAHRRSRAGALIVGAVLHSCQFPGPHARDAQEGLSRKG
jgi:hypothetical protein